MKSGLLKIPALLAPHAAYEHFLPACTGVEPVTCRGDMPVVIANVDAGLRAIAPRLHEIPELLPRVDPRPVLQMGNLARAVQYAAGRVATPASSGEIAVKLSAARRAREPMLVIAEGLAMLELLPAERVAKIRAGTGPYDTASDLTGLVGLYREFAEDLDGQHPFNEARLAGAEELGVWLLQRITPSGATKPAEEGSDAALVRDQLWALLLQRDRKLRVIARVLFEEDADVKVPLLQTRTVARQEPVAETMTPDERPSGEHPVVQRTSADAPPVAAPAAPPVAAPSASPRAARRRAR